LAIIDGVRTPFAKAFGALAKVPADALGRIALENVLSRAELKPDQIDEVIFGNVAGPPDASNVARVIALRAGVPSDRIAHTVNRNCASGMEAIVTGWQAIDDGRSQTVVAGGTESMSNVPLLWDPRMADVLMAAAKAKSLWQKLKVFSQIRPGHLKPIPGVQLGLTDPTCGLNMGETGEVLAKEFGISREEQDAFALESHQKAAAAQKRCFLSGEIVPVPAEIAGGKESKEDTGPRPNQSLEQLAKLRPIFSKEGTITAGNSCPITDGAAAVVLMSAERAKAEGRDPLGYVRAYSVAGCDPRRMGLGPVFATAKLLDQTGLRLRDFDLIEINEAFAAQVLACMEAMRSKDFAERELGRSEPLGEIPMDRLNVNGGAIALGHPVGTSGTRIVITLLRALKERGLKRGLATLCVGGGQGAAVVVETELHD
ncbi:MAG: thiolase family protein, partial [Planctomycetaceae bacterium]